MAKEYDNQLPTTVDNQGRSRKGDWMVVTSGNKYWAQDPYPEEVHIEDIAHALSMQCRFNGHLRWFYSVAQHSVHCSYLVPEEDALWALLHDAAEAYCSDIPSPLKRNMPEYKAIEDLNMVAICDKFKLPHEMPDSVKVADRQMLIAEAHELLTYDPTEWAGPYSRKFPINCWTPQEAEHKFLTRFNLLYKGE